MGQQTSKIAYDVMIQSIENGGMKLVDFESKAKSLKLGFIKKILQNKTGKCRSTHQNLQNWWFELLFQI